MIRAVALALCIVLFLASSADAQLSDLGGITRDESTGLDWLDVTTTTGSSYDDIVAGGGGWTTRNWRHATLSEACSFFGMYAEAPASPCGTGQAVAAGDGVRALQSLLGLTRVVSGQQEDVFGFADNGTAGPVVGLSVLTYSIPADLSLSGVTATSIFDRSTALPTHGHLLVRLNQAPIADAGQDESVAESEILMLSGSATDPDGDPVVAYAWTVDTQPAGSNPVVANPSSPTSDFSTDVAGAYVLSLTASDGFDASTPDSVTITVGPNLPPIAIASADVTSGSPPLTVTFDGSASSDPENGPLGFAWDFDDGSQQFFSAVVVHEFVDFGVYNVRLRVNDDVGQIDDVFVTINVTGGEPVPALHPGVLGGLAALLGVFGTRRLQRSNDTTH